jgi:DNA-binding transcriptional ArsR family regulator
MTLPDHLPDRLVELIAQRFRVIGDPMRIRLLDQLRHSEASVQELTDAIGGSQQNTSKHLGTLHAAGIVSRRKEGTRTVYAIEDYAVFELCEQVCGSLQRQIAALSDLLDEVEQGPPIAAS